MENRIEQSKSAARLYRSSKGWDRSHKEQPSGNIVVLVQDSGVGVDPEHSSRMFEPFYTTKMEGVGMGLTISRSIIEAHGGRLWVIANAEPGSVFCFTLPNDEESKM